MRKVLIANRGEIAVRIARACRDAGLASVAVYAPAIGGPCTCRPRTRPCRWRARRPRRPIWMRPGSCGRRRIPGADALHPGYGYLSEDAGFAQAVLDAGLTWIGPPPAVIRRLGDKLSARQAARQVGAPLLPGMAVPASDVARGGGVRTGERLPGRDQGGRRGRRDGASPWPGPPGRSRARTPGPYGPRWPRAGRPSASPSGTWTGPGTWRPSAWPTGTAMSR